jgi:hypothetical protein
MSKAKKKGGEEGASIDTAILLADSFDRRFTPISIDIPRVSIKKPKKPSKHKEIYISLSGFMSFSKHSTDPLHNGIPSSKWHQKNLYFLRSTR